MTTVLSATSDKKESLERWRKRIGYEEAAVITRVASSRGTAMHSLVEDAILGKDWASNAPFDARMLASQIKKNTLPRMSKLVAMEAQLFSRKLRIAGTVDCISVIDGLLKVVDWKNSKRIKSSSEIEDYFVQIAGYAQMWFELTGQVIKDGLVVMACDDTVKPIEFEVKIRDWIPKLYQRVEAFHATKSTV
jgi:genome maintenance exonuclease 1